MEMIDVNVLFFGSLKAHFGSYLQLRVPRGIQLGQFINTLKEKSHEASGILSSCQVAVNSELEKETFVIDKPYEIAILPPFSGG